MINVISSLKIYGFLSFLGVSFCPLFLALFFFKLRIHYAKLNISADLYLTTVTLTYCTLVVYTT